MRNTQTRADGLWWNKFCFLRCYSFAPDEHKAVRHIQDRRGEWVSRKEVGELVGQMEDEINRLKAENIALQQRLHEKTYSAAING